MPPSRFPAGHRHAGQVNVTYVTPIVRRSPRRPVTVELGRVRSARDTRERPARDSLPLVSASGSAYADLLGLVAFGELLAFERMAGDARLAPDLRRRAALSEMAAAEIANYRRLADRLTALGVPPEDAMAPVCRAVAGVPRLDRAAGLGGGGHQGVRGRRDHRRLRSRDRRRAGRTGPGAGAGRPARLPVRGLRRGGDPGGRRRRPPGGRPALHVGRGGWSARRCPRPAASPPSGPPSPR